MRHFSTCCLILALTIFALTAIGCAAPDPSPTDSSPRGPSDVLLVTGGLVVTMDDAGTVLEDGAVAIRQGRIAALGPTAQLAADFPDAQIVSAAGGIVVPGLINTHTHVPMTLFRGLADDLELMDWLETRIFPAEAANVDEDFVRAGTRLACLEMIRGGTTTFVDMYYFEDAIAEEAAACGLRAVVGETLIDFPAPDNKTWEEALAYTESFLEKWRDHPLITAAVAPHAAYTVSGDHLKQAHALAVRHDAPLLVHLAENPTEVERILAETGQRPIEYMDSLGILDQHMLAAHVVWPDESGIRILAERGVGVAHNPQSNMKIASGVAPVPRMLAAGIAVGLGTDGPASNNDLNMWEEIDTAAKLHKVVLQDPTVLDARTAFTMATLGGARALHMDSEIGSLEVGKRADLVIVSLAAPHLQPLYDPYSHLVYAAKASDVETVIVEGQILFAQGRYLTLEAAPVMAEASVYREKILRSLDGQRAE